NLKQVRKGWAEHIDRAPWWVHFMNFVPRFLDFFFKQARKSVAAYNKRFLSEIGCKIEGDLADPGTIEDFFDCQEHGLEEKQQKLLLELRRTEFDRSRIVKTTLEWEDWRAKNDLQGEPPELLGLMDTKLRYLAFKLATHYWEGQWLLEMEERFDWKRRGSQEISKQKERWRRYAKLTPCIVLTFHMLEWFFNAYGYTADGEKDYVPLYEFIDLLVIDEAGQVSPDLAGANFALARKALVVGDTKQLKPIHNIIPGIDRANIKKHGLASSEKEIRAIDEAGFSVSEPYYSGIPGGNVMKIAQRATRYKNPEYLERGMFLREHYRCVPEIIAFCNELAYGGMLEPQRKCDPEYPLPRIGYLHVPGNPRKLGSSWVNEDEAQAIARWIVKYRKMVEFHPDYINKPIGEIIAVLTPFKAQEKKIKKALERSGFDGITVGTVHVLQGAERPVILYSSVYGPGDILYMMNHEINLLNVAVSRAKDSFLVFGNMQIFKPLEAPLPTGILARHLYEKDTNRLIDDEIIGLQHEQQMVLSATHSINGGSLQRQSSIRLFISYAHADEVFLQELNNHLSGLQRQGIIHDWHDRRIVPGQNRDDQISTALNAAQIILLLISSHFMADDYCYAEEMTRALQRHDAGEVIVIPIILRHFDLQGTPFSNLQALPKNGKPITSWRDRDEAWTDVVKGLRHTINMLSGRM
ncbi:MAG: TIR domain-containing protein, partial [Blastocatellia bacterium]|nr:TIR domain-containing protein [Blastocatellia bacterium]